jgi:gamma-glutamylcyclotransferase
MFLRVIKMSLYFAYGSNLDVEQMKRRCPESKVLVPGCLRGYRLDFTWRSSG